MGEQDGTTTANATFRAQDLAQASTFEVALASEAEANSGVLAQPPQQSSVVTTFGSPAKLTDVAAVPKDASTDSVWLRFKADGVCIAHFVLWDAACSGETGSPTAQQIKTANTTDEEGCARAKGSLEIGNADVAKQQEKEDQRRGEISGLDNLMR